jgi:hypothetical protein
MRVHAGASGLGSAAIQLGVAKGAGRALEEHEQRRSTGRTVVLVGA